MNNSRRGPLLGGLLAGLALVAAGFVSFRFFDDRPRADRAYRPAVERPAFAPPGPHAAFDEAHRNVHGLSGRFSPFARLLAADGVEIRSSREPFAPVSLAAVRLLVVVNAKGPEGADDRNAFAEAEIEAVERWVEQGGALLLVADHTPFGGASSALAERFGVTMHDGEVQDEAHRDPAGRDPAQLVFASADGLLGEHPILSGRSPEERVDRVVTFTGQSLLAPPGSSPLLRLAPTAVDIPVLDVRYRKSLLDWDRITTFGDPIPTRGDCQSVALEWGEGRVVVAGEAALFTAQRTGDERFGLGSPGTDNERFALNAVRWLLGAL